MTKRAYTIALLALPAFALGACSKSGGNNATATNSSSSTTSSNGSTTTTETASTSSTGSGGAVRMEPGEWEMSIEAEGLPAPRTAKTCVTPEMADRAAADMANGGGAQAAGMNCDRSGLQIAGGQMSGTVSCTGPNNMTVRTTINGQVTPTSIDLRQQTAMTMAGQEHNVNSHITGRRTGECTASTPRMPEPSGAGANASGAATGGADKE